MKAAPYTILFLLSFLSTLLLVPAMAQEPDSTITPTELAPDNSQDTEEAPPQQDPSEFDGPPFAPLFYLVAFIIIGVGIGITLLVLLVLFGLVAYGILSASIIVGVHKRSFSKGFQLFLHLAFSIGGMVLGGALAWLISLIFDWGIPQNAILPGAILGLLLGLGISQVSFYIVQKLTARFKAHFNSKSIQ